MAKVAQALGLPLTSVILDCGLQGLVRTQAIATPPLRTSCGDPLEKCSGCDLAAGTRKPDWV